MSTHAGSCTLRACIAVIEFNGLGAIVDTASITAFCIDIF